MPDNAKRVLVVGGLSDSLINFRGDLLRSLVVRGHDVTGMAAEDDERVTRRLAAIGVRFRAFPIERSGINPLADWRTFRALQRAFRELNPDVVLAYTIKPILWGGLALRRNTGPRFFALVTGLGYAFQNGGWTRRVMRGLLFGLYRVALSRASRVIFQNSDNRDVFLARGIVSEVQTVIVNGSGINLAHFVTAPLPPTAPVFLTIGRLLAQKGFREFCQAARIVKATHPDARFQLLGPPDPSPDGLSLNEVRRWHDAGWLEYLGATDDVRPALANCHVFVLASYHEGMPRTILEALATGRPILTTDVSGCRDTVIAGENGYLVPKGDAPALAARMVWFLEHRSEWAKMGARSRQLAEERFNVDAVNGTLISIMELGR
jgi:glycosyltransferase involved in cell wall biosynthesis